MATVHKITLEDRGQDFTEWYIRDGIVIDCQPHQGKVWVGTHVQYPEGQLAVGSLIHIRPQASAKATTLNYRIKSIQELTGEEVVNVEGYGRKWAEIKGIATSELGL